MKIGYREVMFGCMGIIAFMAFVYTSFIQDVHRMMVYGILCLNAYFFILMIDWDRNLMKNVIKNYMSLSEIQLWRILAILLTGFQIYLLFQNNYVIHIKNLIFDFIGVSNCIVLIGTLKMIKEIKIEQDMEILENGEKGI